MASLVRWEPFGDRVSLRQAMDRLFEDSFVRPYGWPVRSGNGNGRSALAVDMYETDEAIVLSSALPGIAADGIDISITGDLVTIKGKTSAEEEVNDDNYICRERRYGSFSRSLRLPLPVIADKANAEFANGVLKLTLPKAEEVRPKVIEVKTRGQ
ncbi:MAG: Hsp20/alpha crystallin family protein [Anaerolineales bacterium]|nr:MAG: Hsp20/alpha crystallin family protein [Anaerolineales bacterium]